MSMWKMGVDMHLLSRTTVSFKFSSRYTAESVEAQKDHTAMSVPDAAVCSVGKAPLFRVLFNTSDLSSGTLFLPVRHFSYILLF